ncbi:hypothetical protein BCR32DRAFT_277404 [Anaeromyces robustus]|uniref:Uncharacterized protein n=1 Tax=Anaeromyces robustus TaxID=1754192 RepID=A0A1Y1XEF9_9FUNG|nr:hypothetical protein BCR32DRAFT_277404 [Anaeromyces robustus]|eukprot:ORX84129.1 hypothetical protein BCR32DRAFT_277404 [Anaeromyces robustus]
MNNDDNDIHFDSYGKNRFEHGADMNKQNKYGDALLSLSYEYENITTASFRSIFEK